MDEQKYMAANSGEAASPVRNKNEKRRRFIRRICIGILLAVAAIVALMELVLGSGGLPVDPGDHRKDRDPYRESALCGVPRPERNRGVLRYRNARI